MTPFDPGVPFTDTAVAGFEGGAAAKAFASLPERWQLVLWHLEVENQKPADIAALLGMSANSVSALAYRAREGLRQAFLNMHSGDLVSDDCRETNELMGGYVRNALSRRDAAKVEDHLDHCRRCTAVYLELAEVNSSLAACSVPPAGGGGAGYLGGGTVAAAGAATGVIAAVGRARDVAFGNLPGDRGHGDRHGHRRCRRDRRGQRRAEREARRGRAARGVHRRTVLDAVTLGQRHEGPRGFQRRQAQGRRRCQRHGHGSETTTGTSLASAPGSTPTPTRRARSPARRPTTGTGTAAGDGNGGNGGTGGDGNGNGNGQRQRRERRERRTAETGTAERERQPANGRHPEADRPTDHHDTDRPAHRARLRPCSALTCRWSLRPGDCAVAPRSPSRSAESPRARP